ncbi:hypothetical protein [Sphingobacterium hotanense]|uniref:hypothetical protein n=1 Tax=Sphingobacterium hotanense TaxID=649196 RepID=UPI0021A5DD19|nr:hypothetical protein [Sphingobacterium hotanense]MCT1524973.1 hypothetical protein [Sphingobacterium hotanense]
MRKIQIDVSNKLGLILAFAAVADNHDPHNPRRGGEEENDKLPNDIIPEADKRPQPENRDEDQPEIDENNPPVSPRDMDMPAESVEQIEEEEITQYSDEEYEEEEEEGSEEEDDEEYNDSNPESSPKPKTFDDRDFNNDRNERRNQQDLFEQEEEEEEEDDMFDDDDYRDNPAGNSELDDRQRGKLDI